MTSLPVLLLLQVILVCCSAETFQLLKTSAFLPLHLTRFTPLNKVSPVKLRASDGDGNGNEDLPSLDDDFFSSVEPDGGSSGTRSSPSRNNKSVVGGWRAKQRRERGSGGKDRNGPVSRPVPNIRLSEASQKLASGGDFQTVAWGDDDTEEPLSYGGGQGGVGWKGGGEFSRGGHRFSWQQPTQEQRDDFGMQGGGLMGDGVDDLFRPSLDSGLDDVLLGDFGGDDLDSVDKRMDHRRRGGGGRRRGGGRGDQFGTLQGILGFDDVDRSSLSQGLPLDESLAAELQKELATFESGGERPDSVLRGGRWAIGGDAGRGGGEKEKGQPGGLFGDVKEGSLASRLGSLWGEEEDGEGERTFQSFVAGNRERRKDQKVAKEKKDETLKLEENENGEREEKGEEGGEGPKWEDFQDLWDEMGNDKGGGLFGDEGKEETEGLFGDERGETVDFEDKDGAMTRGLFGDDEEEGEGLFEDESSLSASWGKTQEKKSKKESWGDPFDMALESEKDTESLWSDDEGLSRSSYPSFLKDGEEEGEDGSSWLRNEERRQQARGGGRESERMGSDMDFSMEREEENNLIDEDGPRNVLAGLLGRFQEPSESRLAEREETQKGGDWGGPPVPSPDSTRRDLTPSNQPRGGGGMYNQNRKATFPLPPPPVDSDPYSPQYRGALPSSSSSSFQPTRRQTYQGGRTDSWKDQRRRPQRDHQFSQRQRGGEREDVQALIAERNEARQKTTQEKAANVLRRWFNSFIEDLDTARHPRILQKRLSILRKRCEDLAQEVPGTSTHLPLHLLLPVVQKLVLWDIEFQDELMGGKGFGQAGQKQKQTDFFTLSPHPSSRLTADFTPVQKAEAQELRSSIKGLIESLFLERFSREGVAISPEDAYWILTFLRRSSPDSLSGSTSESDTQGANTYPTFQLVRQAIIRGGGLAVQMSEEDSEAVESQTKNNHQTETEQPQLAMLTLLELMHFQDRSDAFELILARVADEIQKYKNKGSLSDFPFSGDQLRSLCVYISYAREGFLSEAGLAVLSDTAELLSLAPSESVRPAANLDVVLSLVRARVEPPADLVDSLLEIVRERPEKLQGENVLKILQLQDATGGFLSVSELKAYLQGASPSLKFWSSSGKQERRRLLEGRGGIESIRLISNLLRSAAVEEEAQGEAADETKTDEQPDSLDLVLKGDDEEGEGEGGKQGARVLVKIDLEDLNPLLDLFFKDTQMDTERFRPADLSMADVGVLSEFFVALAEAGSRRLEGTPAGSLAVALLRHTAMKRLDLVGLGQTAAGVEETILSLVRLGKRCKKLTEETRGIFLQWLQGESRVLPEWALSALSEEAAAPIGKKLIMADRTLETPSVPPDAAVPGGGAEGGGDGEEEEEKESAPSLGDRYKNEDDPDLRAAMRATGQEWLLPPEVPTLSPEGIAEGQEIEVLSRREEEEEEDEYEGRETSFLGSVEEFDEMRMDAGTVNEAELLFGDNPLRSAEMLLQKKENEEKEKKKKKSLLSYVSGIVEDEQKRRRVQSCYNLLTALGSEGESRTLLERACDLGEAADVQALVDLAGGDWGVLAYLCRLVAAQAQGTKAENSEEEDLAGWFDVNSDMVATASAVLSVMIEYSHVMSFAALTELLKSSDAIQSSLLPNLNLQQQSQKENEGGEEPESLEALLLPGFLYSFCQNPFSLTEEERTKMRAQLLSMREETASRLSVNTVELVRDALVLLYDPYRALPFEYPNEENGREGGICLREIAANGILLNGFAGLLEMKEDLADREKQGNGGIARMMRLFDEGKLSDQHDASSDDLGSGAAAATVDEEEEDMGILTGFQTAKDWKAEERKERQEKKEREKEERRIARELKKQERQAQKEREKAEKEKKKKRKKASTEETETTETEMLYNDVLFEEGILREGEEISKDTSTDRKTNEEEEEDSEKGKPRWSHRFTLETLRWSLSVHIILLLRAWAKTALSPISVTAALTEEDRSPSLSSLHSSEDLYDTPDALQETETSIEREAIRQSLIYAARAAAALTDSNPWRSSVAATPPTETQSPEGFSPLEEEEDKEETPLSAHPLDFTDAPPELVEQLQNQPAAVAVSAEASEGSEGLSRSSMRGGDLSSLARLVASVCPEGENEHLSLDLLRSLPRTRPDLRDPSAVSSLTEEFKRWQRTLATMRAGKVAKRRRGKKKRKEEAEKENPDVASAGAEAAEDAPPRTGPSTPSPQKTSPSSSASPPSFIVDEALPLMDAWQPSSLAPGPGGESGPERERQMRERQPQLANMSS